MGGRVYKAKTSSFKRNGGVLCPNACVLKIKGGFLVTGKGVG